MRERLEDLGVGEAAPVIRGDGIDRRPRPFEHRLPAENSTTPLDGSGCTHAAERCISRGRSNLIEVDNLWDDALSRMAAADPRLVFEADKDHPRVSGPSELAKRVRDRRRSVRLDDPAHKAYRMTAFDQLVNDSELNELREPINSNVSGRDAGARARLNEADPLPGCQLLNADTDDRGGAFDGYPYDVVRGEIPLVVHQLGLLRNS